MVDELVVVSAAANKVKPQKLRALRPFLGELSSLMKLSDLPYNTRESKSRRALRWQFASAPSLKYQDGRLSVKGAILHIEESPCELAEDLMLWAENWNSSPTERTDQLNFNWTQRRSSDSSSVETVDLLDWNTLRDAIPRARSVLSVLGKAVEQSELDELERRQRTLMAFVRERLASSESGYETTSRQEHLCTAWDDQAAKSAAVSTNLSSLGVETSASLMRHGFALAMAKLHILMGYPLCELPSKSDFIKLASGKKLKN